MTVSYVYSQPDRVAPGTAAKVRAAAERLGYPGPHPGARSLRRGRAGSLGVVLGERLTYAFDDPQATRFLAGVAEVCAAEGAGLTLVPITGAASDVQRVNEAVVDGFIVWTTSDDDPVVDAVAASGRPAVVQAGPARPGLPVVGIDDRSAAAAIGRLAFAGAVRPAVLSFPVNRGRARAIVTGGPGPAVTYPLTRHRWEGYLDAWRQAGGAAGDLRVAVCPVNATVAGEAMADELFRGDDPPDAIAAMSDELALGVLRAAARAGRAVPAAVAVTGWDDSDAAAAAGLTTVRQSLRDQGRRCARIALGHGLPDDLDPASWAVIQRASTRNSAVRLRGGLAGGIALGGPVIVSFLEILLQHGEGRPGGLVTLTVGLHGVPVRLREGRLHGLARTPDGSGQSARPPVAARSWHSGSSGRRSEQRQSEQRCAGGLAEQVPFSRTPRPVDQVGEIPAHERRLAEAHHAPAGGTVARAGREHLAVVTERIHALSFVARDDR